MADEKWHKVREIFDAALHRKPEERREFIREACRDDEVLLAEVESLLTSLDSAENFMETPAVAEVADAFGGNGKKLEKGNVIGHYEIVEPIGTGGMGEVYLAKDQILDRQVAVKILNEELSSDEANLSRFIREAQAASALNHPNILVIHEIGACEDAHFIVSEYIAGKTLREVLKEKTLNVSEVLDVSIQIATALGAAHEARLIHRDIKPENIMIRPDGFVKVLDFGLAKLVEHKNKSILGLNESALEQNHTAKGIIMGTVNYMSPEQAKGEDVDERTDVFSLGTVIFEMIAGQTPFAGDSVSDTFANLINAEPQPLIHFRTDLPDDLQRIVSKMLRKNKDARFQTMKGLLADLKDLKENLTFDEKLERSGSLGAYPTQSMKTTTNDAVFHITDRLPSFSIRKAAPVGIIIVLAAAVFFGVRLWQTRSPASVPGQVSEKRLTVEGGATRAVISQDGRYAAVAQNGAVRLFDLQNGSERILVPASKDIRITTIAFRPDGAVIYFGSRQMAGTVASLFSVPVDGGEPVKILDDIYGAVSFSPDNKKVAFVRRYPELNEFALLNADADGSNINKLASSRLPNRFDGTLAWSPDGSKIACVTVSVEGGFHYTIAKVDASTGSVDFVPDKRWTNINSIVWLADSQRVLLAGQDEKSVNLQVWRFDTNTGESSRITNDLFLYESISGTPDGRSIVAVKVRQSSHVWMLGDQQIQLTGGFDNYDGVSGLSWSTDGNIFYHSRANGRDAIWRMQIDGSQATEITPDTAGGFAVSPDGRLLVFQAKQSEDHLGLQLMNLLDGSQRSLTESVTAMAPAFFPDGKRLVFGLYDKKLEIFEVSVNKGQPKVLNDEYRAAMEPIVSPSGRFIAFVFNRTQQGKTEDGIAVVADESKQIVSSHPVKVTTGSRYEEPAIQWSADESAIYFIQIDNSVSNIMKLKLSDGTVSKVTNFADGRIFNFAVEPGGKRMLIARGLVERDATLLQLDQPM